MDKPHAPACLRNRDPILAVLCQHLADCRSLLEIGSGTGQHAVYFGAALPQLRWQTSDLPENHHGIDSWIAAAGLPNVLPPLALDVDASWPKQSFDAVFSANTLHIMDWQAVRSFFAGVPSVVRSGGTLIVYGPFCYGGLHTSPGNARFDASLRQQPGGMGIRDFEAVDALATATGLVLQHDRAMPANNRCLIWQYAG